MYATVSQNQPLKSFFNSHFMCFDCGRLTKERPRLSGVLFVLLPFRPLGCLPCLLEARFLALFGARVAHQELGGLEYCTGLGLCLDERAGERVAHCVCLRGNTTTLHVCGRGVVLCALALGKCLYGNERA